MISPMDIKETVGFLYTQQETKYKALGTCFFVNWIEGRRVFTYIVTNRHVVEETLVSGLEIYLRVNRSDILDVEYFKLDSKWVYHHDTAVDIAILLNIGASGANPASASAIPADSLVTNSRLLRPLDEGVEVFFIGMLTQFKGSKRNYPVMRQGHIALLTDELIEGPDGPTKYYLIECVSHHGNSGSPLFMASRTKPVGGRPSLAVLGVVSGSFQQDILNNDGDPTGLYENSGISLVTPAQYVDELLRQDE